MKQVRLDIDLISCELYDLLLKEFRLQGGNGTYTDWELIAVKEE
jgi:hypothetical protein